MTSECSIANISCSSLRSYFFSVIPVFSQDIKTLEAEGGSALLPCGFVLIILHMYRQLLAQNEDHICIDHPTHVQATFCTK